MMMRYPSPLMSVTVLTAFWTDSLNGAKALTVMSGPPLPGNASFMMVSVVCFVHVSSPWLPKSSSVSSVPLATVVNA